MLKKNKAAEHLNTPVVVAIDSFFATVGGAEYIVHLGDRLKLEDPVVQHTPNNFVSDGSRWQPNPDVPDVTPETGWRWSSEQYRAKRPWRSSPSQTSAMGAMVEVRAGDIVPARWPARRLFTPAAWDDLFEPVED